MSLTVPSTALVRGPGAGHAHPTANSRATAPANSGDRLRPGVTRPGQIDPITWALYAGLFGTRLGHHVDPALLAFVKTEIELSGVSTEQFIRGADRLLGRKLYGTFPGAQEFVDASREGEGSFDPVPSTASTLRLIDGWMEQPLPSPDVVDAFRDEWQRTLAHCKPEPKGAAKAFALLQVPVEASEWAYQTGTPRPAPRIRPRPFEEPAPRTTARTAAQPVTTPKPKGLVARHPDFALPGDAVLDALGVTVEEWARMHPEDAAAD